jgi:C1A family cysteine protease
MDMVFGWRRDLPDVRDYTEESTKVQAILNSSRPLQRLQAAAGTGTYAAATPPVPQMPFRPGVPPMPQAPAMAAPVKTGLPTLVDLRQWCSPIEDQNNLGSCCAQAAAGILEYFERRAFGKYLNASRLFIYKTTRNLMGLTGDTGADLRSTMKALVMLGAAPEQYWPYNISRFDVEPTSFIYSLAQDYKSLVYYRLDPAGITPANLLTSIKTKLAAGLPSMFGFTVYSSISNSADIPYPKKGDTVLGGHAVCAVGFSDDRKIGTDVGALFIRNSWGTSFGDAGYCWLPYSYVLKGLATDFWTLVQASYVDTDLFR